MSKEFKKGGPVHFDTPKASMDGVAFFRDRANRWYRFLPDKSEQTHIYNMIIQYVHHGHVPNPELQQIVNLPDFGIIWKVKIRKIHMIVLYRGGVSRNLIPLPPECVDANNQFRVGSIDLAEHLEDRLPLTIKRQ